MDLRHCQRHRRIHRPCRPLPARRRCTRPPRPSGSTGGPQVPERRPPPRRQTSPLNVVNTHARRNQAQVSEPLSLHRSGSREKYPYRPLRSRPSTRHWRATSHRRSNNAPHGAHHRHHITHVAWAPPDASPHTTTDATPRSGLCPHQHTPIHNFQLHLNMPQCLLTLRPPTSRTSTTPLLSHVLTIHYATQLRAVNIPALPLLVSRYHASPRRNVARHHIACGPTSYATATTLTTHREQRQPTCTLLTLLRRAPTAPRDATTPAPYQLATLMAVAHTAPATTAITCACH